MNENEKVNVTVPMERYTELIQKEMQLDILTNALLESAELNYNDTELRVNDTAVNASLKALWPAKFRGLIEFLKKKKDGETVDNPL